MADEGQCVLWTANALDPVKAMRNGLTEEAEEEASYY